MTRVGIREYDAKRLLSSYVTSASSAFAFDGKLIQVTNQTDIDLLKIEHPWLLSEKLVVKPDQLFGKRGKNELVLLNTSLPKVREYLVKNLGKNVVINKVRGTLDHFLVEPYVEHTKEYYLAFKATETHDLLLVSDKGGVDIEENWDTVSRFEIPVLGGIDEGKLDSFLENVVDPADRKFILSFAKVLYSFFVDFGCVFFEANPLAVTESGATPLGCAVQIDDSPEYEDLEMRKGVETPSPFGTNLTPEEIRIMEMDAKTGSSLKLVVLNSRGRVWTLNAGGGASVIFADTISDLGYGGELANYGEYSGNPSADETYQYAKTIIGLMVKNPHPEDKILFIGGAIANFTDIAKTFAGIVRALREARDQLIKSRVRIYVRRGGPNYEEGLTLMRKLGEEIGIPIRVFGPETYMTEIVKLAFADEELEISEYVKSQ